MTTSDVNAVAAVESSHRPRDSLTGAFVCAYRIGRERVMKSRHQSWKYSMIYLDSHWRVLLSLCSLYAQTTISSAFSASGPPTMPSYSASGKADAIAMQIETGRRELIHFFDFPLDDWQLQAGGAIHDGFNVIVSAPTGAGKTVVGEMALHLAIQQPNKTGIYTTPLKALSNQKFSELSARFGRMNTGLSTGDISINKGARVTVMTTEVYRNIAWRSSTPQPAHVRGNELTENAVVVLDEFHYMGNPGRGGVWEESIITSPTHTQIVGLSATLANAPALASWMKSVTGRETVLVEVPAIKRPVPLRYLFATKEGLYPLFRDPDAGPGAPKGLLGFRGDGEASSEPKRIGKNKRGFFKVEEDPDDKDSTKKRPRGLQINPALKNAAARRLQRIERSLERSRTRRRISSLDSDDEYGGRSPRKQVYQSARKMSARQERKEREHLLKKEMRRSVPSLSSLVGRLDQKDLLPAIFFIFSRAGCDEAARSLYRYMQGASDPGRLSQDEVKEFAEKRTRFNKKKKKRGNGRERDSIGDDLLRDSDGRAFRPGSNFISDDVIDSSLYEATGRLLDDSDFDEDSPLSVENWAFYAKAGLLNYDQVRQVASRISVFNNENEEIALEDDVVAQLMFGVGSHHAGMLPAHKSFAEVLFRLQLMKVVFATETLAAGINMPARTTVICSMAKRGDDGMSLLVTSNLLQMAGRAGRRGMDSDGTCVIVATPFETHDDAANILTDPIAPISSQFSPGYSLAINLIDRGQGKLDIAKQLVRKSFAMWERRRETEETKNAIETDGAAEVVVATAQDRFMVELVDTLQGHVDSRSATFDIERLQSLIDIISDREQCKRASKALVGAKAMLNLELVTLEFLEKEQAAMPTSDQEEDAILRGIIEKDQKEMVQQVEDQRKRALATEKQVNKHPFTKIADIANSIMASEGGASNGLVNALRLARQDERRDILVLSASELCEYAKASIVVRRKTRKLAKANPGLNTEKLLLKATQEDVPMDDSWVDFLALSKTLLSYGCLKSQEDPSHTETPIFEDSSFEVTAAGLAVGMLGFDNALWFLVAMGGAWDVIGNSSKLDEYEKAMELFDEAENTIVDQLENEHGNKMSAATKSREEAQSLVSLLKSLSSSQLAGYVSCLVSEGSRGGGALSVVEQFQRVAPAQQRAIQKSLLCLERLVEVQRLSGVDESSCVCSIDISHCEVVTAWAAGCSWSDALEISGLPAGDLVRILSRSLDALRQLGGLPFTPVRREDLDESFVEDAMPCGLDASLRLRCREARTAIERYPVKDPFAFEISEEEELPLEDSEESDYQTIVSNDTTDPAL